MWPANWFKYFFCCDGARFVSWGRKSAYHSLLGLIRLAGVLRLALFAVGRFAVTVLGLAGSLMT